MDTTINLILFYSIAALILSMSVLAVTTKRILRAASYLLFILLGTAGLYLLLNYHFLAAVQVIVYAGGVLVLFIFAIFLVKGDIIELHARKKIILGILAAIAGVALSIFAICKHRLVYNSDNTTIFGDREIDVKEIGYALMGMEKQHYLLPFAVLSIMLLACVIGGILIARKR